MPSTTHQDASPSTELGGASLEITGLTVRYGAHSPVVHDVDIDVPAASTVALLGANGAGKTSILRAVTGLLDAHDGVVQSGRIVLDGVDVTTMSPFARVNRGIAQVLEGRRVFADLSVEENLRSGAIARRSGRSSREVAADLDAMLDRFPDLADRRKHRAGLLSGGQQQMVAIGRALMARPRLLLLDEPSLGLAPKVVEHVGTVIGSIADEGVSVILIEQNASLALALSDHAYVLESGRITVCGPASELAENDEVRRAYLGA